MRRMVLFVVTCAVLVGYSSALCGDPNANDEALAQRFLEEAPVAWERYRQQYVGKFAFNARGEQLPESGQWKYWRGPNGQECLFTPATVYGRNSQYAFELRRTSGDREWVLVRLERGESGEITDAIDKRVSDARWPLLWFQQEPLWKVIDKPYFKITSAREVAPEDVDGADRGQFVEIEFTYHHDPSEETDPIYGQPLKAWGGKLVLDPQHHWTIRRYEWYAYEKDEDGSWLPGKLRRIKTFENVKVENGLLVPVSSSFMLEYDGKRYDDRTVRTDYLVDITRLPQKQFTLTRFGLDEPSWFRGSPPWWLYVGIAGVALILIGSVYVWLRKE